MFVSSARPDNGARDKPRILILDQNRLRQAGIMHLLEAWADVVGLTLMAVPPDIPLRMKAKLSVQCKMVILSLGGASVEHPQQRALIEYIRTILPEAALVVLSDREEPEEVCAAFLEGAAGFMPTSIDPSVAFQALSFIKGGGTFFPPSALLHHRLATTGLRSRESQVVSGDCVSQLTTKQKEVFNLLRQGQTNKTIARRLGLSDATVKVHVRSIMRKFGVTNRTQLAIAAINGNTPSEVNTEQKDELEEVATLNVTRLAVR
jgi:DNA-binding NarL/FixJ family response regulator